MIDSNQNPFLPDWCVILCDCLMKLMLLFIIILRVQIYKGQKFQQLMPKIKSTRGNTVSIPGIKKQRDTILPYFE